MTVDCVTVETSHLFEGNPIADQHKLRHRLIIQRQQWEVPAVRDLEYDNYDNPATTYLIWRDKEKITRGVSRLYPTDRPFMLQEHFAHTVSGLVPAGADTWEGSRFCIDNTLDREMRLQIAREIVIAYLEYGLAMNITRIIGIMYPVYWNNLFTKNGWQPVWIGDIQITPDGKKSRAAILPLSAQILESVRNATGIHTPVINYGTRKEVPYVRAA